MFRCLITRVYVVTFLLFVLFGFCLSCNKDDGVDAQIYTDRVYTPPPIKGDVYVVINTKSNQSIYLSAEWGPWKHQELINISNYVGLVLHLNHLKNDSVPLTITTDGDFVKDPYQGEAPTEWDNAQYKKVMWD